MSTLIPDVDVPEGKTDKFVVERFTIGKNDLALSMMSFGGRSPGPGTYTRLRRSHGFGGTIMSDTQAEKRGTTTRRFSRRTAAC